MQKAHLDFETRSAADLPKCGTFKYAADPSTDIMCMGIRFGDQPVGVCGVSVGHGKNPDTLMRQLFGHVAVGGTVAAHNAPFELAIWNHVGVRKYGWPPLLPEQMDCTMARAYAMGLPGSLDAARAAVGITTEKDMAGNRLMMKMSRPRGANEDGSFEWFEDEQDIEKLFAYCKTDVEVECELDKRLRPLSQFERKIWVLDYKINNRGITIDTDSAVKAAKLVEMESERLDAEMRRLTGEEVATCNATKSLAKWINDQGVETKGVAKDAVTDLLSRRDLPENIRLAISVRKEAAKSSTGKLATMLAVAGAQSRLRGMHQYSAANTRRWAGRLVQLHNFPKPKTLKQKDIEKVFAALEGGVEEAREYIEIFHGSPMTVISESLRGFLCAAPGKKLNAIDWNSIEARVTPWLAGQLDVLEVFRTHGKIYEVQAGKTYGVSWKDILKDDPRRQVGKVQVLGLGFQGGVGALQKMCATYETELEPAFDGLWRIADGERRSRVEQRWESEHTKAKRAFARQGADPDLILRISKKEWLASELIKLSYRDANANVVRYWRSTEEAAIRAVECPGAIVIIDSDLPPVKYCVKGSFLLCLLPSGGVLVYPYPEVRMTKTSWGEMKKTLTYKYQDERRKWVRGPTYGGSLVENNVQSTARDILAETMFRVDKAGYEIVMHVHDEFVVEDDEADDSLKELERMACVVPTWAVGLPLAAEGWSGKRYRK